MTGQGSRDIPNVLLLRITFSALFRPITSADEKHTLQVLEILQASASEEKSREELQMAAAIKDREHFRKQYLEPLLSAGLLERSIPDKLQSSKQRYNFLALESLSLLEKNMSNRTQGSDGTYKRRKRK